MKRKGNLYNQICSLENLRLADQRARIGKGRQYGIQLFDRDPEGKLCDLRDMLLYKEFTTSPYTITKIFDSKERDVYKLPYYPDRIVHHAVMAIAGPILSSSFTADTYACIKGRGIHAAGSAIKKALKDQSGTRYCLKMDIRKFYPSINHDVLRTLIRRKIKDPDLLWLMDDIINSAPGLPIGNYLSQCLSNFYLSTFDHWIKETKRIRYYFRYADDMAFLAASKPELHALMADIRIYLKDNLHLDVKGNYQVFPVEHRGIDMLGYVYRHQYTRIRKTIKKNFARAVAKGSGIQSIAAYWGWCKHANTNHLMKKLIYDSQFQGFQYKTKHKRVHRTENRDQPGAESKDNRSAVQGFAIEIQE